MSVLWVCFALRTPKNYRKASSVMVSIPAWKEKILTFCHLFFATLNCMLFPHEFSQHRSSCLFSMWISYNQLLFIFVLHHHSARACWVLRYLLPLLASTCGTPVHPQARNVVESLLQSARLRDPYIFRLLATELINCLSGSSHCRRDPPGSFLEILLWILFLWVDLADFDAAFFDENSPAIEPFELRRFDHGSFSDSPPSQRVITIKDPEMNQQLQINIRLMLLILFNAFCSLI